MDVTGYVVNWQLAMHQRGELVQEAVLDGIARFGKPQEVLSDGGLQYFAWRSDVAPSPARAARASASCGTVRGPST